MIPNCPRFIPAEAQGTAFLGPCSGLAVPQGYYFRSSDCRRVRRYRCRKCLRYFSQASFSACFGQKKRRLNPQVESLLCSGVSMRRSARLLRVNPKTIARKMRFLGTQARAELACWRIERYGPRPLANIQFDDLETSEHSKCKPLSVALAVDPKTRRVLSFQVSRMPAKGLLKAIALKKYGQRRDERGLGWKNLMEELKPLVRPDATFRSDENPHYPRHLKRTFPKAMHERFRSRRACVAGQGELKRGGFDPLFALNHTCAMLRANMNRLFRRTWCTTKKIEGLVDHLAIYVSYHNRVLTSDAAG
jgi:hypothetical protein